jgi:hypothetical protein
MVALYDDHARAIGAVAITWGGAQESLFMVFCELADIPRPHADAIFFALKADSAQRDITVGLAEQVLTEEPHLLAELRRLITLMGKSAGERNAAIHTMWRADREAERVGPSPITRRHHPSLKPDHLPQFYELADRMVDVGDQLFRIAVGIRLHLASRRKHPARARPPESSGP